MLQNIRYSNSIVKFIEVTKNNLITPNQLLYRKAHSTKQHLIYLKERWREFVTLLMKRSFTCQMWRYTVMNADNTTVFL